ncbi:hypothetical protein TEA_018132 [Camellia sinensis var. sinensis]|uniref:Uncharacterized protein n=1 Tax=Camellia sinensis var. sinensis TaxID=542762 RepID=A0A4S4ED64_CAMSN|nr:hypothetical protein TEA_018132 [Camellia sinensis var. sinensis]
MGKEIRRKGSDKKTEILGQFRYGEGSEQQAAVKANDGISSTSGRKHRKKKNACEVLHGFGSSVNPKSSVGIPKDAGKRQVHTTGRSSGQWCMGPDGKGVYASESGLELMVDAQNPLLGDTTCGSLLQQVQRIWDEVGECDEERDKMLLQLELECLDVYKRKVDQAAKSRARLLKGLADANVELSSLLSALGEKSFVGIPEKSTGTINEQLTAIAPVLEQLWKQKEERIKEFFDVQSQIQKICGEIAGTYEQVGSHVVDEADLSLKKLDEFQSRLQGIPTKLFSPRADRRLESSTLASAKPLRSRALDFAA